VSHRRQPRTVEQHLAWARDLRQSREVVLSVSVAIHDLRPVVPKTTAGGFFPSRQGSRGEPRSTPANHWRTGWPHPPGSQVLGGIWASHTGIERRDPPRLSGDRGVRRADAPWPRRCGPGPWSCRPVASLPILGPLCGTTRGGPPFPERLQEVARELRLRHRPCRRPAREPERLLAVDGLLVAKGFPALSPFWRRALCRFLDSDRRQLVVRAGRRAGKSTSVVRALVVLAI